MKIAQNKIPQLRFPNFLDKWKSKKLGEVAKFSKGKGISKSEIVVGGKNDCIRYGELYTLYGETISEVHSKTNNELDKLVISEANDVIIPASGETQIDIATASCVLKDGIILGGDLNIIKTKNNGVFLSYYLNSKKKIDIARLSQGVSVIHLYASQLSSLKLNFPQLPEQQKIASFLTSIDTKITLLTRKKELLEEYKKSAMKKIFKQKLRFKDDDGTEYPRWKENKLGSIIEICSSKRVLQKDWKEDGVAFYRTREIISLSKNREFRTPIFITEELYNSLAVKYGVPKKGDLLVSGVGTIGSTYVVKDSDKFYFKDGNVIWFKMNDRINSEFLYQQFKTRYLRKQLSDNASITTVATFTIEGARKTKILLPSIEEQTKIANFLSAIDTKIKYVGTQLEKTKTFKKGLLQQLFV